MSEANSKAAIGIHQSRYARDRRELISLMDRMRSAGVSSEIDIPRIAIIGNQSAGKSSLVEAISGIKVPRDSGTCTRCPFEVRIRQTDEPWNCQIFLRFETGTDGRPLDRISETRFGKALHSPDEVEAALRRAQLAILNPSVSPSSWAKASDDDVKSAKEGNYVLGSSEQLSFSTNLVCIDISGPEVTDLAFLDLPGIISNVEEGEDPGNIDLIKGMVDKVITGNCLILLTLSMRDDIENQSAMRHARTADPEGKRTIGVLTKADTLQEGEHQRWIQILQGQRAKLSNGYFATRLPGAADLGKNLTFDAARVAEKDFFNATAPWSTIPTELRRRLGIPNLTTYLSEKLSSYIKSKLPEIRKVVNEGFVETQSRIDDLPPPPSIDPLSEMMQLLQAYRSDLDAYVAGSQGFESLIKDKNRIQAVFADNIRETRPRLYPFAAEDVPQLPKDLIQKSPVLIDCSDSSSLYSPEEINDFVLTLNLNDVTERIERLKTRELPVNVPFRSKSSLMVESTKGWSTITANALDALRNPVLSVLNDLVEEYFGRYAESGLTAAAKDITDSVSAQLFAETESRLRHLIELENIPFTLNNHYYEATLDKSRARLKHQRQESEKIAPIAKKVKSSSEGAAKAKQPQAQPQPPPTPLFPPAATAVPDSASSFGFSFQTASVEPQNAFQQVAAAPVKTKSKQQEEKEKIQAALAALASLGYNVTEEDLPKLLPPDKYADELDVMSHVMANWKVAYKRIIDNVPRFVDYDVLQKLPLAVSTAFAQLASGGSTGAAHYLREGLEVQELRAELKTKLTRITEAKQLLSAFGRH